MGANRLISMLGAGFIAASLFSATAFAAPIAQHEGTERPEMFPQGFFLQLGQMQVDLSKFDDVDPGHIVPTKPLAQALSYFDLNKTKITNQKFITIIDFTQNSSKQRMFVIDMTTGQVQPMWVAHGSGSDPDADGNATKFSNIENSKMSSLGFSLSGTLYQGGHGTSMYLHGLEATNSNMYEREIVMHGADYVYDGHAGRSWGCPAVDNKYKNTLFPKLAGGSLIYMYYNQ